MQVFDEKWTVQKGQFTIKTRAKSSLVINVSCTQDVQVFGMREGKKIPLKTGRDYRFKIRSRSFDEILIKGKPSVEYGLRVEHQPMQDGEPLNDDNPPSPPMPKADNLLQEIRNIFAKEQKRTSVLLDPEDLPWAQRYEIDEDDEQFEEDILLSQQEAKQKAEAEAAEAAKTAEPGSRPQVPPQAVPEAPTGDPEPASPAQAAE